MPQTLMVDKHCIKTLTMHMIHVQIVALRWRIERKKKLTKQVEYGRKNPHYFVR